jgi:hypothetical protein
MHVVERPSVDLLDLVDRPVLQDREFSPYVTAYYGRMERLRNELVRLKRMKSMAALSERYR